MKHKILSIAMLLCATIFMACSNIIDELTVEVEEKFETQTKSLSVDSSSTITTVTSATSSNTGIVTVTKNEDGSITLTAQSEGTTTLTVTGTDESGATVTITYTVTVAANGTISVTKSTGTDNSGGDDTIVFVSQTKEHSVTSDSSITTVTLAESANTEIVEVLKFDDDSIVLKSQSAGTTTLTVEGTDEDGEPVTITYNVTVAADGTITVSKSTNTGNTDTGNTEPYHIWIEDYNIKHGTVTASAEEATAGTEITLSATPDDGYKLASYSVSSWGIPVPVTNGKFIMPDTPVDVSAVFVPDLRIEINYGGNDHVYNTILDFSKSGSTYTYHRYDEIVVFADGGATLTVSGNTLTLHVIPWSGTAEWELADIYDIVVNTQSKTYTVSHKSTYDDDITIKSWTEYGTDSSTDLSKEWTVVAPVNNISVVLGESDITLDCDGINMDCQEFCEISGGLDGYDYTNIVWYVDGIKIEDENSVKGFSPDGTKLYYVNSDLKANHTYDVYVELTQNGRTYSATGQVTKSN